MFLVSLTGQKRRDFPHSGNKSGYCHREEWIMTDPRIEDQDMVKVELGMEYLVVGDVQFVSEDQDPLRTAFYDDSAQK